MRHRAPHLGLVLAALAVAGCGASATKPATVTSAPHRTGHGFFLAAQSYRVF